MKKTKGGKKPLEMVNALVPEGKNIGRGLRPIGRLANPLDEQIAIMKKERMVSLCKKMVSYDQNSLDKMLLKAMEGTILEADVKKAILFLDSPIPLIKLLAIVTLSDVRWQNISKESCELAYETLKKIEKDPDKNICRSAHKVMEKILEATLWINGGERYDEKKAA